MKHKKLLLLLFLFVYTLTGFAQRAAYLQADGQNVAVNNLLMHDSLGGGKIHYSVSFAIPVNNDPAFVAVLNSLQKMTGNFSVFFTRNGAVFTERQYRGATVTQVQLSKLDASAKTPARLEVKFSTTQVTEQANASFNQPLKKFTPAISNSFSIALGNLPASRIAVMGPIDFKPNALVSLEIAGVDMDAWRKQFSSVGKKLNGNLLMLAPNLADKLQQFTLNNVELVSITQSVDANSERIERFMVQVRIESVSLTPTK